MRVLVEHTTTGVYCTSCGVEVDGEHTSTPSATCFYVARRFPHAMEVLREIDEASRLYRALGRPSSLLGPRSGFGLRYRRAA